MNSDVEICSFVQRFFDLEYNMQELTPQFIFLWIFVPLISGLIGWLTNWVAVKMLLHPLTPKRVLGMKFHGLIPRRINDLANRIALSISRDFLTTEDIQNMVTKVDLKPFMVNFIREKWDSKLDVILDGFPLLKTFLPVETLNQIRDKIIEAFSEGEISISEEIAEAIGAQIDLESVIRENILAFDLAQLDSIINEIASKEFRYIERLGGVIGVLVGVVQMLIVTFLR